MRRTAFLVPCLGFGGAERQISIIAPLLNVKTEVIIISMISPVAYVERLEGLGVRVFSLDMIQGKYSVKAFVKLMRIIRAQKVKQLITFNYPANFIGRAIKLIQPQLYLVSSFRSSRFGSPLRDNVIKFSRFLDDKTVPNSFSAAEFYAKKGIIDLSRLHVIRNGIEIPSKTQIEQYAESAKSIRAGHLKNGEFLWIAVGRLEKPKDYPTLLRACKILKERVSGEWRLMILGDGPLKSEIEDEIEALKLTGSVFLTGRQKEVFNYYFSADAFVSSSAWEGMPNALIEAMLAALPIVSTDVGEVSRIVPRDSAQIVESENPEMLANAMYNTMQLEKSKLTEIGICNSRVVKNNFDINNIIRDWFSIIE